ncbi:hypothetical protein ACSFC1_00135 [Pseudothermotoga sp. U03pept]|uniref:hypothetical protein n=1 Tax=Pseudothermotoga sp. U03pept TaxID=3447012 RepID=UPI003F0EE61C
MLKKILITVVVLTSIVLNAAQFKRTIEERIEIQHDGSAIITRTESVPPSELSKYYKIYFDQLQTDMTLLRKLSNELGKSYYFLYGTTPSLTIGDLQIHPSDGFKWTVRMKAQGFLSYENKQFVLGRKRFEGDEKSIAAALLRYFKNELDEKIFISVFLGSEKNSLETTKITEVVLPEGSIIEAISPALPTQKEAGTTWNVDFGGQNTYKAVLERKPRGYVLRETINITGGAPKNLLDPTMSAVVLSNLRDYASFKVIFSNQKIRGEGLTKPVRPPEEIMRDNFSGSWGFSVSSGELFSYTFSSGPLRVTPKITVTLAFNVSLTWEHEWVQTGWFSWSYRLKKFETAVSFSPSLTPSLEVSSGGTLQASWSKDLARKSTVLVFWVGTIPVVLVLEASLDVEAEALIRGSIGLSFSSTYAVSTSLKVTYENGSWRTTPTYNVNYSNVRFQANAKVATDTTGRLPFTLAAYIYYVAGPFVRFTPSIKGETYTTGSSNQVGYRIKGGISTSGGVQMAGWLQSLCGGIPSVSYQFWNWERELASGTYTF